MKDKLKMWFAWHMPKWLAYWCTVRLGVHATTGRFSDQVVPDLTYMDTLKRWERLAPKEYIDADGFARREGVPLNGGDSKADPR